MQGIHEGTEAMLLPTLLAAVPSVPILAVCVPAQVQQHAPTALSCTPSSPSLCFLLFWVTAPHAAAVVLKVSSETRRRHLQLLGQLLMNLFYFYFECVVVLLSPLCIDGYDGFCHSFFTSSCMFIVFAEGCTPGCITPQLKEILCTFIPFIFHLMKFLPPFFFIIFWELL